MQDFLYFCQSSKRFHDKLKSSKLREKFFMIKLISVDMDGTFLNSKSKYNEVRFKKIHDLLNKKGIHFVVASCNQYYQLKDFFTNYNDIDYVAENGALIRNSEKVYAVHSYSTEAVKKSKSSCLIKFLTLTS